MIPLGFLSLKTFGIDALDAILLASISIISRVLQRGRYKSMKNTNGVPRRSHIFGKFRRLIELLVRYGISGLQDEILNRRRLWSISGADSYEGKRAGGQTSITDVDSYLTICELAIKNGPTFNRFRSCTEYRTILEHVTRTQGQPYLDVVQENKKIAGLLPRLVSDDTGSPIRYSYSGLGRVSPTSLRYAKVLSDIDQLFGNLDRFVVSEIGVGFGGQCLQICDTYDIARYELYDLGPVLDLASKYVLQLLPNAPLNFPTPDSTPGSRDLVISNYAFSELVRDVQETYLQTVIQHSARGYVTFNHITPPEWGSLSAQQFASRIPGAEIMKEFPLTDPKNVLVVWGHNGQLKHQ